MSRMEEKIRKMECMDVRVVGSPTEDPDVFALLGFIPDVDYADAKTDRWIWSIGESLKTHRIYAATDARFYQNPEYKCLWLR